MRRFVFAEGSSNKFWEIEVRGDEMIVRFGKVGTEGRTTTKSFDAPTLAETAAAALIAEKLKKGYAEASSWNASEKQASEKTASAKTASGKAPENGALVAHDFSDADEPFPEDQGEVASQENMPKRFVYKDCKGGSYCRLEVRGSRLLVRSGKLGAKARVETQDFASNDDAEAAAVALIAKETGTDVSVYFQDDDDPPPWPYELGDRYWDVGSKGSRVVVHFGALTPSHATPIETQWTRFETSSIAKAAEKRIQKTLEKAQGTNDLPALAVIARLNGPVTTSAAPGVASSASPSAAPCPCAECARLADEGAERPSLSSSSTELTFTEYATPLVMAGKQLVVGVTPEVLRELCERVDAFAKKHDEKVVVVAHAPPSWPAEGVMGRELVIGRLVAVGDHFNLTKLSLPEMRQSLTNASSLPWKELLALLSDPRIESPRDREWESQAEPDDEIQVRVFATGALASGLAGFGVPMRDPDASREPDNDDGDDDDDPSEVTPDLQEIWGQDMDQKRQSKLVYGELAGCCDFHDNEGPDTIDVSAAAHKARAATLGALAKKAGYYLVGRYD